jgi:hypothetical protein
MSVSLPVKSTRMIIAVQSYGLIDINVMSSGGAKIGFMAGPKTRLGNMPNLRALTLAASCAERDFASIRRDWRLRGMICPSLMSGHVRKAPDSCRDDEMA